MVKQTITGSFRDPAGFVYKREGEVFRCIKNSYKNNYELFINSGLYNHLTKNMLLIKHEEIESEKSTLPNVFLSIRPSQIPFISYPYEWSFSQLKDAALLTLNIQNIALEYDMSLKDASAYNVQFNDGKPIFIDTLSFEKYKTSQPWVAYQQFCEHFLAPLVLMSRVDMRLNKLLCTNIDGIPIEIASKLLPITTYFKFGLLAHVHSLAFVKKRYSNPKINSGKIKSISKESQQRILQSLKNTILNIQSPPLDTEWGRYYEENNNYKNQSMSTKERFIVNCLDLTNPQMVWDFGANSGRFSRIASSRGIKTIAFDVDYSCVESSYKKCKELNDRNLLPLLFDMVNPSPAIGWDNSERDSLSGRGKPELVFALALIHHLAISNNLPLERIAQYLAKYSPKLIIEFVPKNDSMVQQLLTTREDIFPDYTLENFLEIFKKYFSIIKHEKINGSYRHLYLMERKK